MAETVTTVPVAEIATVIAGQSPPGDTYNTSGVGLPFIQGCAEFGHVSPTPVKWCSADKVKRAQPGDVLLSVRAPVGRLNRCVEPLAIGRGVAALRGNDRALTDYLALAIEFAVPSLEAVAVGSTFAAVTRKDIDALEVPLLTPSEQRRVVDLITSFDGTIRAVRDELDALRVALSAYLAKVVAEQESAPRQRLGDLALIQSGVSWNDSDVVQPGDARGIGVMGVSNVQRDYAHAENCGWIKATPQAKQRAIEPHTLLTIRTNGNADRIGNVHRAPAASVGFTISSFLTSITTKERAHADYIARILQSPPVQGAITDATSGSTGLKNLAVTWLRDLEVPWPAEGDRDRVVATAAALEYAATMSERFLASAVRARRGVLDKMLTGNHSIPSSYDRFLAISENAPSEEPELVSA